MNKFFTRFFFLLFIYFLTLPAFAQKDFKKGYYITSQQDTITGYIQDKNWVRNPNKVNYKATPEANEVKSLTAASIKEFGLVAGDQFMSAIVTIDKSSIQLQSIPTATSTNTITDTVFLQVVNKGAASLFYLKDENGKEHFYYQKQPETPVELKFGKFYKEEGGKKVIVTSEIYKGQLFTYFADCPNLKKSISDLDYEFVELQAIFQQYNQCQGKEEYIASPIEIEYQFGLLGGLSKTNLTFVGAGQEVLTNTTFQSSVSTLLGLSLNLVLPRSHKRWMIHNELLWKPYSAKAEFFKTISPNNYRQTITTFKMNYIGLGNMIRYHFSYGKIKPFLNAGIANNFSIKETNTQETFSRFYNTERRATGDGIASIRKYEQALLIGAGVSKQRISAEIRLEAGNGISQLNNISSEKKMLGFILGYNFN